MSRKVVNKGGIGVGAPYDFPGYEYDPVNDSFKDLETGKTFTKDGNAKLETSKSVTVSENGPQIITPSPTYDGMEKVVLDVQVPQGGDIEANKAATIDVSAYTEPVEITPTAGKDGMEKCTVTLSNIPSGGGSMVVLEPNPEVYDVPSWINFDPDHGFDYSNSVPPLGTEISLNVNNYPLFLTATGDGTTTISDLFTAACNGDSSKLDILDNAYSQGVALIAYTDTQFAWAGHCYYG